MSDLKAAENQTQQPRRFCAKKIIFGCLAIGFILQSAFVYTAGTKLDARSSATEAARDGMRVFQEYNCVACHQIYGLGGYIGPDLTNVASAPGKGRDYARVFLENGTDRMPDFGLDETEVRSLLDFLDFVAASGAYPPADPEMTWYGTVKY